jgi:hypothetical protein
VLLKPSDRDARGYDRAWELWNGTGKLEGAVRGYMHCVRVRWSSCITLMQEQAQSLGKSLCMHYAVPASRPQKQSHWRKELPSLRRSYLNSAALLLVRSPKKIDPGCHYLPLASRCICTIHRHNGNGPRRGRRRKFHCNYSLGAQDPSGLSVQRPSLPSSQHPCPLSTPRGPLRVLSTTTKKAKQKLCSSILRRRELISRRMETFARFR